MRGAQRGGVGWPSWVGEGGKGRGEEGVGGGWVGGWVGGWGGVGEGGGGGEGEGGVVGRGRAGGEVFDGDGKKVLEEFCCEE